MSEVTVHPKLTKEYRQGGSPQRRPVFTNPEADQEGEKITNIMTRTYKVRWLLYRKQYDADRGAALMNPFLFPLLCVDHPLLQLNQPLQSAVDIVEALRVYQAGHDALLARASAQLHEARVHRDEAQDQRDEAWAQRDEAWAQRDEAWAQRDEAQAEVARAEARAALAEARAEAMVAQSAQAQAQAQIAKAQAKIHHTEAVRARRENQQLLATLAGMRDQRKKANISSRLIGDESPHGAPNRTGDTNSGNIKAPGEEQDDALLPALP